MINQDAPYFLDAYGIAAKRGFDGNVDEWLESLKGRSIEMRQNGDSFEWRYVGEGDDTWQRLADFAEFREEIETALSKAEEAARAAEAASLLATEIAGGDFVTPSQMNIKISSELQPVNEQLQNIKTNPIAPAGLSETRNIRNISRLFAMLEASEWTGTQAPFEQTLSGITGVLENDGNDVEIDLHDIATATQVEAWDNANIKGAGQATDQFTVKAWGDKPTADIPIRIKIVGA